MGHKPPFDPPSANEHIVRCWVKYRAGARDMGMSPDLEDLLLDLYILGASAAALDFSEATKNASADEVAVRVATVAQKIFSETLPLASQLRDADGSGSSPTTVSETKS